jgi:hypothetical protein
VLPILLITGFFAYQAYQDVEPAYSAASQIVVLPAVASAESTDGGEGAADQPTLSNPYSASGGTRFAATVLARNLNNTAAIRQSLAIPSSTTEIFSATPSSTAPIVIINAQAASPARVLELLDQVTAQAGVVLEKFQTDAGAPVSTMYRLAPAVPVAEVENVTPSPLRTVGAIVVIGLGLATLVAATLDSYLRRRADRRKAAVAGKDSASAEAVDVRDPVSGPLTNGQRSAPADGSRSAEGRRMGIQRPVNGRGAHGENGAVPRTKDQPTSRH